MEGAIVARDVAVSVDGQPLLGEVSFTVPAGTCLAVRGENGSGKTTLLRVLTGLQRPTQGSAHVLGRAVDERDPAFRRSVAGLVGVPPFARELTLAEHLQLVALTWGVGAEQAAASADSVLDELGLAHLAQRFVHQLSSGQTQLFSLALTLARPCEVLVVDEPEQRLDGDRLALVEAALGTRVESGTTLVMATHSSALAAALAHRTLTLAAAA